MIMQHTTTHALLSLEQQKAEERQVPSVVVPALLCHSLAVKKLCTHASCSHVESCYIFNVSPVIGNLTSDTWPFPGFFIDMQRACQQHGMTAMMLLLQGAFVACTDIGVFQSIV